MGALSDSLSPLVAQAVVEALAADADMRERLRELLEIDGTEAGPPAYTVGSLAAALEVSPTMVRNAITCGDLQAVKRGGRWVIAPDSVAAWCHDPSKPRFPRRRTRGRSGGVHPLAEAFAQVDGRA